MGLTRVGPFEFDHWQLCMLGVLRSGERTKAFWYALREAEDRRRSREAYKREILVDPWVPTVVIVEE